MLMQKNNKVMDIDAKLKAVALSDNKLGLLQGKLGASIYFFVMSNHDEKSEMFQTGKELFVQVATKIPTLKNIDLKNGLMGIWLGISYLVRNDYITDSSGNLLADIDAYIYKMVVKTIDMDLQGKEIAPLIDVLAFETFRYKLLSDGVEKDLCRRFIVSLFNSIYMDRPLDFYSEAIPFRVNDRLIVFLLTLVEIRNLGIGTERIDHIFQEMQPFLLSLHPVLHPNRYILFLVSSLVAQASGQSQWIRFSESLKREIDMCHLFTNDLYDKGIMLLDGVLGLVALTWWYNTKSQTTICLDMDEVRQRIENSSFWNRMNIDEEFIYNNYSLSGLCGIKLLTRTWEENNDGEET